MTPVRYEGPVPRTLRAWCDRHAEVVEEVAAMGGFAWAHRGGFGYDVLLRRGWSLVDGSHIILEPSVSAVLAKLRGADRCDCDRCKPARRPLWATCTITPTHMAHNGPCPA